MSALETLPPDQRAVLQLILTQGRGYDELAGLLKLDVSAVRDRAHAGVAALAGPGELEPEERAGIADYLLGQQDEAQRIVTLARLGESAAARRWAESLQGALAPLAREPLPPVPAEASTNGAGAAPASARPASPRARTARPRPSAPRPTRTTAKTAPSSSRVGGAILLAAIAALLIALAVLLIGGGDDDGDTPAGTSTTPAQTQTQSTTAQSAPQIVGQVNLTDASGGAAVGIGFVQQNGRRLQLALQAQKLPANGQGDIYATWLQGSAGTRFLGFVPNRVGKGGTFAVSAPLPRTVRGSYDTVLVTREGITAVPQQPGTTVLSGKLAFRAG